MTREAMNTGPDLTVSIVSTNNLDLLLPCLRSVFKATHRTTLEVYVIDNASADPLSGTIHREFPQVRVLRNSEQLGFSTNNNMVLARGRGRYLMLLNDDTIVLDGALDNLVAFADGRSDVGIVGSFLLNPDLTFQPSFSRSPSPWIEGFWPTSAGFPRLRAGSEAPIKTQTVCGAALMIRRETMVEVGLLDTRFDPIYAEETDWCYRAKAAGWEVYSNPRSRIIHYGGQTMNRIPKRKLELLQSHKALFFHKHHGLWAARFFKASLRAASLLKTILYSMLGVWAEGRAQQAELHKHVYQRVPYF